MTPKKIYLSKLVMAGAEILDKPVSDDDVEYIRADIIRDGSSEIPNDQPLPEDTVLFNKGVEEGRRLAEEEQADLFTIVALDAAQRAKEQMMKDGLDAVKTLDFNKIEKTIAGVFVKYGMDRQKEQMMEEFPKWRKIKAGERLPCPAYVWTIAYDNYPDCFEGRLMPNIQGVKVGRDTWYLPVDVIHNLPKED